MKTVNDCYFSEYNDWYLFWNTQWPLFRQKRLIVKLPVTQEFKKYWNAPKLTTWDRQGLWFYSLSFLLLKPTKDEREGGNWKREHRSKGMGRAVGVQTGLSTCVRMLLFFWSWSDKCIALLKRMTATLLSHRSSPYKWGVILLDNHLL